jgi:hypothetical protein
LLEEAKGTGEEPIEEEEREELSHLRDEYQNLRDQVMSSNSSGGTKVSGVTNRSVDSSSGESEEEDYVQPLPSATRKP